MSQTFPPLTMSLQRSSEHPEGEANDAQGMQEGRESGQGVSEEIQGEKQGAVAFPPELPPPCAGRMLCRGAVCSRSRRCPAGRPMEAPPGQIDPTALCFGAACCSHGGSGWSSASLPLLVFQFEGNITILTQMMVDPAATEKRGGGKNLPLRRGEILDVIQFTNKEQILCRNSQRRCKSATASHSASAPEGSQLHSWSCSAPSQLPLGVHRPTRFSWLCCRWLCAPGCDAAPVSIPSPALLPAPISPAQIPPAVAVTGGHREVCPFWGQPDVPPLRRSCPGGGGHEGQRWGRAAAELPRRGGGRGGLDHSQLFPHRDTDIYDDVDLYGRCE